MAPDKKLFVVVGSVVSLAMIAIFIFVKVRPPVASDQPATVQDNSVSQQASILSGSAYQGQATSLLNDFLTSSQPVTDRLARLTDGLGGLTVASELKADHLLIFSAFDIWRRYGASGQYQTLIVGKLRTFGQAQTWSTADVNSIIKSYLQG